MNCDGMLVYESSFFTFLFDEKLILSFLYLPNEGRFDGYNFRFAKYGHELSIVCDGEHLQIGAQKVTFLFLFVH